MSVNSRRDVQWSAGSVTVTPRWLTCAEVAKLLGYGETKVRMLIASREIRSLKDGRSRRVLPEWVEEYVQRRAHESAGVEA